MARLRQGSNDPYDIRSKSPARLSLPATPKNLAAMSREQLLKTYDHFGDYWAVWLGKANMLPEMSEKYTDYELKGVIALASGTYAHEMWKFHDINKYPDEHAEFYENFFQIWDKLLGRPMKKRRNVSSRRSPLQKRNLMRNRQKRLSKSKKGIKNTKSQIKLRSTRPSPSISAAESAQGLVRKGNDGRQYIVKADKRGIKRWHKIKERM